MFYTARSDVHFYEIGRHLTVMFVSRIVSTVEEKLEQEAVKTACTRGFNIFAKFCCRQSKLLQSSSCISSALHCG